MYIKIDNNGWAKNTAIGTQSKQEELLKGNYWTELYITEQQELDEEGNIISTIPSNLKLLKLENNQIVLKTQADRDVLALRTNPYQLPQIALSSLRVGKSNILSLKYSSSL